MVEEILLSPGLKIPNNPDLPVLLYRQAFSTAATDLAADMEKTFCENGWPAQWRNGIYPFHHYHCEGHEVLGIAAGRATVMLGGPNGQAVDLTAGDAVLLPAGTGHCRIDASEDFLVVGAYPPGQHADIVREAATEAMRHAIAALPFPDTDPVFGAERPLSLSWRRR